MRIAVFATMFFLIIVALGGIAGLATFFLYRDREKKKEEKENKEKEEYQLKQKVSNLDNPEEATIIINRTKAIVKHELLDNVAAGIIQKHLTQIMTLLDELKLKSDQLLSVQGRILGLWKKQRENLSKMEDMMEKNQYDLAMSMKHLYESSEQQEKDLSEVISKLNKMITTRKSQVKKYLTVLDGLCSRAENSVSHSEATADFSEYSEELATLLKEIYDSEVESANINVTRTVKVAEKREEAHIEGISANDVKKMKVFLKEKQKKSKGG